MDSEARLSAIPGPVKQYTAGGLIGNSLIELVRPADAELQFVVWRANQAHLALSFVHGNSEFFPLEQPASLLAAVNFPISTADYESIHALFDEVSSLIERFGGVLKRDADRLAFFVLATWFADVLPFAPFLWIIKPAVTSHERLMQLLSLLCRYSLRVSALDLRTLQCIPAGLYPTLLVEISGMSRSLEKALRASTRRDTFSPIGSQLRSLCCAKIIVANQPFDHSVSVEPPLEIALSASTSSNSIIDIPEMQRNAALIQKQLLKFRLENRGDVALLSPAFPEFAAPLRTFLATLGAPIWADSVLRARLTSLFEVHDRQARAANASSIEAFIVEALLAACHADEMREISATQLAKSVNTMSASREGGDEISPETVGWKLRKLGVSRESLSSGRNGVKLTEETRRLIHELSSQWQTRSSRSADGQKCAHCANQLALVGGESLM